MDIPIIYEDEDLIAVNKPSGVITHRANLKTKGNELFLTDWLVEKFPEVKNIGEDILRPGIVHRLDKETSGVLIVAKNQTSFAHLKSVFKNREVIKKYIALVEGNLKINKGIINMPIGRSKSDFRKKLASPVPLANKEKIRGELKNAITEYKVLEKFSHYTLVEVYPKTGRTHQIRAHFKAIGHPVARDALYGGRKSVCPFGLERQFLHANFLEFTALSGLRLKLEADLTDDLDAVIQALRKNQ